MKNCRDCICYGCMVRDDCPENLCDERDCYKKLCDSYESEYDWEEQEHEECEN